MRIISGCKTFNASNCDRFGVLLYEDIGCQAIMADGAECPIRYECGDLSRKNGNCFFKGANYRLQEYIDDNVTYPSCNVGCYCDEKYVV